jgi:PAP2 superfamily
MLERLAACKRERSRSFSQRIQMRNGAHGHAPNACERFTAGFTILLGAFIALQARTTAATAAVAGDGVFAVFLLVGTPRLRHAHGAVVRYLGVGLPLAGFYFLYLQTGLLDPARTRWHDATLLGLQSRVLPHVPYVPWPPLREWLAFSYLAYEPILCTGTAAIFAPGSQGSQRHAGDAVRRLCYTLACCFVIGLAYPAMSPRYVTPELQVRHLGSGFFSRMAVLAGRDAMVPGTSFPSAHVAAVVVLMWDLWAVRRGVFWIFLPLAVSMTAGTVLLFFHYVPDVVGAVVVGAGAIAFDRWWNPRGPGQGRRRKTKATAGLPLQ